MSKVDQTIAMRVRPAGMRALGRRGLRVLRRALGLSTGKHKVKARQLLLPLRDDSMLNTFGPDVLAAGTRFQQDDRPIVVGPWVSELGFEVLYWIPFLKWFVERFDIAPERLVFLSRGGMGAWYDRAAWNGRQQYMDAFSVVSPETYRDRNALRWRRAGGQKQIEDDPFEVDLVREITTRLQVEGYQRLHPRLMYKFFVIYWTHASRLAVGADLVLRHARYEPLHQLAPWRGTELPASFVAVKLYDRPSLPPTADNAARIRQTLLTLAEHRPVISLDTRFHADEHEAFPLPDHPNIASARDWLAPEANLLSQTQIIAAADFFLGTYGGTAYLPAFVGKPAIGLYSDASQLNFAHQLVVMRASQSLGHGVTLMPLEDFGTATAMLTSPPCG